MKIRWNQIIHALACVRIGQELGSDSKAARFVHDAIDILISFFG